MRFIALVISLALATPALAAEPWEGVFTPLDPDEYAKWKAEGVDTCAPSSMLTGIDSGNDTDFSPITLVRDTQKFRDLLELAGVAQLPKGYIEQWERLCVITQVTNIRDMPAWLFDVVCGNESWDDGTWHSRRLYMQTLDPDGMAVYSPHDSAFFAPDGMANYTPDAHLTQLYRCPSPSPRPKPSSGEISGLQLNSDSPFIGYWAEDLNGCDSPMFRFEVDGYAVSGQDFSRFTKLVGGKNTIVEGGIGVDYNMTFPDDYSISLLNVTTTSMTWHSLATGDTFDLVRCPAQSPPRPKP